MTSTLSRLHKTAKTHISAQELIKKIDSIKIGFIRKKKNSRFGSIGKWPHKFIVLAKDSIYVYDNETSNKPNANISLVGYNSVIRSEGRIHEWSFSVMPAKEFKTVKVQTFACISNDERKSWMKAIRNQIYEANNIEKPSVIETKKMEMKPTDDTDGYDSDYLEIEEMVYGPDQAPDLPEVSDTEEYDSFDSEPETSPTPRTVKTQRSQSVPHVTYNYTDASSLNSKAGKSKSSYDDATSTGIFLSRLRETPQHSSHSSLNRIRSEPSEMFPPRYSDVCRDDEEEPDYANFRQREVEDPYDTPFSNIAVSLEDMCTIKDKTRDRDHLIQMLKAKKEPGTYLIRKSRQSDLKVLSFLTDQGEVKEYKIFENDGRFSLDDVKSFEPLDDLLKHYTSVEAIPHSSYFLKKGFHSVTRSMSGASI